MIISSFINTLFCLIFLRHIQQYDIALNLFDSVKTRKFLSIGLWLSIQTKWFTEINKRLFDNFCWAWIGFLLCAVDSLYLRIHPSVTNICTIENTFNLKRFLNFVIFCSVLSDYYLSPLNYSRHHCLHKWNNN